jgi:hypothetical protein
MIKLPDFEKSFEYENDFYLSCNNTRLHKTIAHYELFKMTVDLPGDIVECGVFKGASFIRFAGFRDMFGLSTSRKLLGFDTFGTFPETGHDDDQKYRQEFIDEAGSESISKEQLMEVLKAKKSDMNVELIEGDLVKTAPEYVQKNPNLTISFINLDTDVYEPAVAALEYFWPRLVRGGVLVLDDYGVFPGETKAVDDYFKDKNVRIQKLPYAIPSYIVKD